MPIGKESIKDEDITPWWFSWWEEEILTSSQIYKVLSDEEYIKWLEEPFNAYIAQGPRSDLSTYKEQYWTPTLVYYPCCSVDTNPSLLFPNIVYADQDKLAMKLLSEKWFTTITWNVLEIRLFQKPDMIYILNPQINNNDLNKLVKDLIAGWHVLCNNYHWTADSLKSNATFDYLEQYDTMYLFQKRQ